MYACGGVRLSPCLRGCNQVCVSFYFVLCVSIMCMFMCVFLLCVYAPSCVLCTSVYLQTGMLGNKRFD